MERGERPQLCPFHWSTSGPDLPVAATATHLDRAVALPAAGPTLVRVIYGPCAGEHGSEMLTGARLTV